jgi:bifunctional pyridoxal-dependent enzyme with beta-cystathionase and maltose regulon repressor activities
MAGQVSEETREWLSEVLPEVLRDEDIILRPVERGLLWLEWNPTDKNYLVWMLMNPLIFR